MAVKKSPTTKESKNISSKSTVINKAASNVNSSAVSRSTKTPAKPEKIEKEIVKKKNITNADKKSSAKIELSTVKEKKNTKIKAEIIPETKTASKKSASVHIDNTAKDVSKKATEKISKSAKKAEVTTPKVEIQKKNIEEKPKRGAEKTVEREANVPSTRAVEKVAGSASKKTAEKQEPLPQPVAKVEARIEYTKKEVKPTAAAKKASAKAMEKIVTAVKPTIPAPRPTATPATRTIEKKPNIIIAHRKLENKSKLPKDIENSTMKYQTDAYRSILDSAEQATGPVFRYSDEDLIEFRELIISRLEAAKKELNYLQGLITRKDEAGTEDTENRFMNVEDGSGAMEREQLAQMASRQIQFLGHLEKAMVRIENKTYGICRVTGKLIDKARLRAVPHATLSIDAKKMMASK